MQMMPKFIMHSVLSLHAVYFNMILKSASTPHCALLIVMSWHGCLIFTVQSVTPKGCFHIHLLNVSVLIENLISMTEFVTSQLVS